MNFPIFVPKGEVKRTLSPPRRHILTVVQYLKESYQNRIFSYQIVSNQFYFVNLWYERKRLHIQVRFELEFTEKC